MNLENYECDGQVELTQYLKEIAPPAYCEDCVFLEGCKCGLGEDCKGARSLNHSDGWERIKHHENNTVSGKTPECMEWREVITFCFFKGALKYKFLPAQGKDKTFKWAKEFSNPRDPGEVHAWRYKE